MALLVRFWLIPSASRRSGDEAGPLARIAMIFRATSSRRATAMAFRAALASSLAVVGVEKPLARWVRWRISLASSAMEMRGESVTGAGLGGMARGCERCGRSWLFAPVFQSLLAVPPEGCSLGVFLGPAPRSWQNLVDQGFRFPWR